MKKKAREQNNTREVSRCGASAFMRAYDQKVKDIEQRDMPSQVTKDQKEIKEQLKMF